MQAHMGMLEIRYVEKGLGKGIPLGERVRIFIGKRQMIDEAHMYTQYRSIKDH